MAKHLFIGGSHDGHRIDVFEGISPIILNVIREPEPVKSHGDTTLYGLDYETEAYKPIPFCADKHEIIIYALYGMKAIDVFHALIRNYPDPKDSNDRRT